VTEPIFTPEQLAEIRAYHWPHYVWATIVDPIYVGLTLAMLRWGVRPLYAASQRVALRSKVLERVWGDSSWSAAMVFAAGFYLAGKLINLPTDLYFDWFHERAYGLSTETFARFTLDYFKDFAMGVCATAALALGLFGLARRLRRWWVILGAVAGAALLVSAAIDPYRGQVYFEQTPLPAGELRDAITRLMAQAKIDVGDVVVEKTSTSTVRVGAYFAGQGPTRTIVLNDALIANMSTDEVLAAVAHEAGHVHESRWLGVIGSIAALFGFLYLVHRLFVEAERRRWMGIERYGDIRVLPAITLAFFLCALVVEPVSGAVSRQKEREADASAVKLTGNADAFRRMLVKAARINKMDPEPPWWIVLKGRKHPPIAERIAATEEKSSGR
jgi:STE24 endopeptidase